MQRPLQITFKNIEPSPLFDTLIRERAAALERFHKRLMSCRVVVEVPHASDGSGKLPIAISVEVEIPHHNMIVAKDQQERHESKQDHTAPINRAFDAVERQLVRIAERQTEQRVPAGAGGLGESGMVVRLFPEQRYGFVEVDNGPELYFTENAVDADAYDELEVGSLVHLVRASDEGPMGPQAKSLKLLSRKKSPD